MKAIFKTAKSYISTMFSDIIAAKVDGRYQIFDSTLYFDEIGEDFVVINKEKFYAIEVSHYSNVEKMHLALKSLLAQYNYSENAKIHLFLVKNRFYIDKKRVADPKGYNIGKESIYLFCPIKQIINDFSIVFEQKPLDGLGIMKAIFDIVQINEYYNDEDTFFLKSNMNYDSLPFFDSVRFGFKKTFAEGVYKMAKDYEMYISNSVNFHQKDVDFYGLFRERWNGYFYFYFDFNAKRVEQKAKFFNQDAQKIEKSGYIRTVTKDFYESVKMSKKNELMIFQSVALVDNPYITSQAETYLGVNYIKKELFRKDIIYKTPLKERDLDFDMFVPLDLAARFAKSIHKRHNLPARRPNVLWGADITGNYITYSFSESASPHFGIFAPTRTGKSFFLQKLVTQIIRYDTDTEVKKATRLGKDKAQIRYFDIGESARKLTIDLTENHADQVLYYGDDVNEMRFSFTDVDLDELGRPVEEDMDFMLSIMDIVLEINGEEPLSASEKAAVKKAYRKVYENGEYDGVSLTHLSTIGYKSIVNEIYRKYPELKDNAYAKTIDLPNEYAYLKKPILQDVITYLEIEEQNITALDDIQRDTAKRAKNKLNTVNSIDLFKYYNKGSIEDREFFYMELNNLKSLGEKLFVPAFWFIFRKLYNNDVKQAVERKRKGLYVTETYYIIEEAHNFVKFKSFENLFNVIAREAAKYKIHICFVTQYLRDLPEPIIKSLGSKIILPSANAKDQIVDLEYIWGKDKQDFIEFFKNKSKKYTAFIDYDYGLITIKPPISERELWLFNSEAQ